MPQIVNAATMAVLGLAAYAYVLLAPLPAMRAGASLRLSAVHSRVYSTPGDGVGGDVHQASAALLLWLRQWCALLWLGVLFSGWWVSARNCRCWTWSGHKAVVVAMSGHKALSPRPHTVHRRLSTPCASLNTVHLPSVHC